MIGGTNTSGGFGFGQTSTLGTTGGGFSFGQPATTSNASGSGFSFGQNTTASLAPKTGFSLGQTTTTSAAPGLGLSFGQAAATSAPALGQAVTSNTTPGGFSFGQPAAATSTGASTGFSLAQPTSSTTVGFSLPQPQTTTVGGLNPTQPAAGGFSLTQPSTGTTGFSLGQTTLATTSAPTLGFSGLGAATAANTSAPTLGGLSFNTSSSTPGLGLSSLTATTTSSTGFSFLGSTTTTTTTASTLGLGGLAPASSAPSIGLGGAQPPNASGLNLAGLQADGKSTKETPLPPEIFATIEQFETYKSNEKTACESNVRQTAAPFHKLGEDTTKLKQHVLQLSNKHSQLQTSSNKLKAKVMEDVENVKMARQTQDTPMNQQGDNKAPEYYFLQLVRSFEERMQYCRTKIEEVESCNRVSNGQSGVSAEDIKDVLKREHETLKIMAAKVYTLHNKLIDKCEHLNRPKEAQPKALFKPRINETSSMDRSPAPSSVLRPLLGEGGSGLLNFQAGQQRAKAMSLGAPPIVPLAGSNSNSILGGMNQSGIFSNSSLNNSMWGNNNTSINNNNAFKFNTLGTNTNNSSFGANNTTFGANTNTFGAANNSNFGFNNFNNFGAPKPSIFGSPANNKLGTTTFGAPNTFGSPNTFGAATNNATFSSPLNSTGFGNVSQPSIFGTPGTKPFGS